MKYLNVIPLIVAITVSGCSHTAPVGDTYTMPKGGMNSAPHEMHIVKGNDDTQETDNKEVKKQKTIMQKGGMSSVNHEMNVNQ